MRWPFRRTSRIILDMSEEPAAKGSAQAFVIAFAVAVEGVSGETMAREVTIAALTEYLRQHAPERLAERFRDPL